MKRHSIRRMSVVQYDLTPERVGEPPKEVDERLEQGLLDERGAAEEWEKRVMMRAALAKFLTARGLLPEGASRPAAVLEAVLRFLASSDAEMLLVNIEDLWLEREPVNRPGVPERSWRRRMRVPLEQLRSDLLRMVNGEQKTNDVGEDHGGAQQARPA